MSKPLLILTLAALGCGTAAAYFHSQLRTERLRNDELQTRIAHLEASRTPNPFAPLPRQLSPEPAAPVSESAPKPAAALASAALVAQRSPAPVALSPEKSMQMRQRFVNRQRELMKDPEYRQAMRTQQRFSLQHLHPDLAGDLNLSQEQADRLLDLLADQQLHGMQSNVPFTADSPLSQAEIAQMQKDMQQRQQNDRAEIAALLGDGGLQQWEDYQNSMGARMRVRQLSSELDGAGVPLREDQRQPLRDALAQFERQALQEAQRTATAPRFDRMTPLDQVAWQEEQIEHTARSHERARDAVAHILTGEQLAKYQEIQERELTMRRAHLRIQRAELGRQGDSSTANTIISVNGTGFSSLSFAPAAEVTAEQ